MRISKMMRRRRRTTGVRSRMPTQQKIMVPKLG